MSTVVKQARWFPESWMHSSGTAAVTGLKKKRQWCDRDTRYLLSLPYFLFQTCNQRVSNRDEDFPQCFLLSIGFSLFFSLFARLVLERNTILKIDHRITDFKEIWHECSFQKNIWPVCFFYWQSSMSKGWKLISKFGFCVIDETSVFFNDEFNGVYYFSKKKKNYFCLNNIQKYLYFSEVSPNKC